MTRKMHHYKNNTPNHRAIDHTHKGPEAPSKHTQYQQDRFFRKLAAKAAQNQQPAQRQARDEELNFQP